MCYGWSRRSRAFELAGFALQECPRYCRLLLSLVRRSGNTVPHYNRAPITEAIIDLQVRTPPHVTAEVLREAVNPALFPKSEKLYQAQMELNFPASHAQASQRFLGLYHASEDGKRVVQARTDGFTFSRLPPYDSWEQVRGEAREAWSLYRNVVRPEAVHRIALRYINRFDIPLPLKDFKDYFRTVPEVSSALPQGLSGYFMQLQIPYVDLRAMLVLTQAVVPPPRTGIVSIVLDIDVACANNALTDDNEIWQLLDRLRDEKNKVFEGCITDAARELIR